jgi:hypothetical protein
VFLPKQESAYGVPTLPPIALDSCHAAVVEAISFNGIAACMINIGTASESPIPIAVMEVRPTSKATLKGYRK